MNLKTLLHRLDREIEKDPLQNEGERKFFFEVLRHVYTFKNPTVTDFITQYVTPCRNAEENKRNDSERSQTGSENMTARIEITAYPNGFSEWEQEVELDVEDILSLIDQLPEKERLIIVRSVLKRFPVREIQKFFKEFF